MISAIVVNFNAGEDLTACVRALLASKAEIEVFIVDNGSTDGSLAQLRDAIGGETRLTILENGANLGFARANNRALPAARGRFLLFINPDCVVAPDTLERMARVLEALPDAGMAGPLVLNSDGSEQEGCRRAEPTPWRSFVRAFGFSRLLRRGSLRDFVLTGEPLPSGPTDVDAISGAFMLVRRAALDEVGPLDEGYFLHCEDLDWCHRFRLARWRVVFVPDVVVTHAKGRSSREQPIRVLWHKHRGMIRYYRKFFRARYPGVLMGLVVAAVWLRFCVLAVLALPRSARSA